MKSKYITNKHNPGLLRPWLLRLVKYLTGLFFMSCSLSSVVAAPADLDTSFDTDGYTGSPGSNSLFILHPDGRILRLNSIAPGTNFGITAIDAMGTAIAGGGNGDVPMADERLRAGAIQSDGKIVVTGSSIPTGGESNILVARFNQDLSLDTSFGSNGIVIFDVSDNTDSQGASIGIQADDKILIAPGYTSTNVALIRLSADGDIDSSFGTAGEAIKPASFVFSNGFNSRRVPTSPDGKIYLAGIGRSVSSMDGDMAVMRLNTDGSVDTNFGENGIAVYVSDSSNDVIDDINLQSDGKVLVAGGSRITHPNNDLTVIRFDTTGTLDSSFDSDGVITVDTGGTLDNAFGVLTQPDGKIVFGGYGDPTTLAVTEAVIARFNSDGSPDATFGTNGVFVNASDGAYVPRAIQSDGKILAFASSSPGPIARFEGNAIDTQANAINFTDQSDVAFSSVIESNTIAVGGLTSGITVPLVIKNGEYKIGAGTYTANIGYVSNGDQIQVRHTSSASNNTPTNTTLSFGGVNDSSNPNSLIGPITSDIFTSTTLATGGGGGGASDTTPDAFAFTDQTDVAINTTITSNAISVTGIDAASDISITGGEYSINGSAATTASSTVLNGDSVTVTVQSSSGNSGTVAATLTIGGIVDEFSVTTVAVVTGGGGGTFNPAIFLFAVLFTMLRHRRIRA